MKIGQLVVVLEHKTCLIVENGPLSTEPNYVGTTAYCNCTLGVIGAKEFFVSQNEQKIRKSDVGRRRDSPYERKLK